MNCRLGNCGEPAYLIPMLLVWPKGANRDVTKPHKVTIHGLPLCKGHAKEAVIQQFIQSDYWGRLVGCFQSIGKGEPDRDTAQLLWKPVLSLGGARGRDTRH